jgi:glycosyltransferase involved in cell wall biosynthesis
MKFSIVTPSFNQTEWLRLAIASVADQEGVDYEHIIQDGGTDGITDILQSQFPDLLQQKQLEVFVEKDTGMFDALSRGLKRARGEICAHLNCDEQYLPGALAQVARFFAAHPEVDVLFGDAILLNAECRPLSYRRTILPSLTHLRVTDLNTLTCATFFRRSVVEAGHLFPAHLKFAGDQYWVLQLLQAGIRMDVLHEPFSVFAFTGSNLSTSVGASKEKLVWLPSEERPSRWLTLPVVLWHRLRKLFAGAYRRRNVTVEIYTQDQPERRRPISSSVGFRWPKSSI